MAGKALLKKLISKPALDGIFITVVVLMGLFLYWKIYEIAVFSMFIWIILNPVSSRVPAGMAIILLIFTPLFLIGGKNIIADQLAIYAYYFLIMAVMMGIYELRKNRTEPENPINNLNDKTNE